MKFLFFYFCLLFAISCFPNGPLIPPHRHLSKPDSSYRFSQASSSSKIETFQSQKEEKPAFTLNIHAPQESTEEIIESLKDLKKLVNQERKAADDDFLLEKKKLVEAQRIRVRDIVHSGFEAINSLIPNPIKSEIRSTLKSKSSSSIENVGSAISNAVSDAKNTVKGLANKGKNLLNKFRFQEQ